MLIEGLEEGAWAEEPLPPEAPFAGSPTAVKPTG
jgi:hypothetical protein